MRESEHLSNRVREYRKRAGIRQSDLAEQVGVARQTIIAIEKARFNPSVMLALRIARALGLPIHDLFSLTPSESGVSVECEPAPARPEEPVEMPVELSPSFSEEPEEEGMRAVFTFDGAEAAVEEFAAAVQANDPAESTEFDESARPRDPKVLETPARNQPVQAVWDFV